MENFSSGKSWGHIDSIMKWNNKRREVRLLEWVAMLTMLIDHLGYAFFSDYPILRAIGRISFPLYCYFVVKGIKKTSNRKRYIKRLFFIAVLSQVPYNLVFQEIRLNVVFVLFFGAVSIVVYEEFQGLLKWFLLISVSSTILYFSDYMSYGIYGILLCFLYYFLKEKPITLIFSHVLINIFYNYIETGLFLSGQMLSLIGTFIIMYSHKLPEISVPRNFYKAFYPVHLLVIGIVLLLFYT